MILLIICVLAAATVGMFAYALIPRGNAVHDRIAQLAGINGSGNAQAKKIFFYEQMYNKKSRDKMQQQLQEAGWYEITPAKMAARSITGVVVGLAATLFFVMVLHVEGFPRLVTYALPLAGYMLPGQKLKQAIKERKAAVQSELPDFVDMVSSTVAAGVALNGALLSAVDMCQGPLGDEFRAALADIRMGRSRADALGSMATRVNQVDLSQMVTAIVQSERVGGNVSVVLEELAQESRERRLMLAEEIAGTLPVKMTIPMAVFLLPALIVVLLGPVVVNAHL